MGFYLTFTEIFCKSYFQPFFLFYLLEKKESTLSPAAVRQPRRTWKDKKKTPSSFPPVLRWKAERTSVLSTARSPSAAPESHRCMGLAQ